MVEIFGEHTSAKKVAYAIIVLVAVAGLAWYSLTLTPIPVETFSPDGSHLGDFNIGGVYYNIFHLIFGTEVDVAWVTTTGLLQYLVFPFCAIWLVMYGIFEEIIFFRRVTWFGSVMALITALVVSSTGYLVRMMRGYLMMAGTLGIAFFGFILILGLGFWFFGRLGSFGFDTGSLVSSHKERGELRKAFIKADGIAGGLLSHDSVRAGKIQGLVTLGMAALGESPPNMKDAKARLADIQKEIRGIKT